MRRLDNIDLRLLRVFVTLVEAGGFTETQVALNLSASTLSTHLAALERKIGGRLCDRGRGGFRVTAFGEAVYKAAKQLFAELEAFDQRIGQQHGQLVGRLRIGIGRPEEAERFRQSARALRPNALVIVPHAPPGTPADSTPIR